MAMLVLLLTTPARASEAFGDDVFFFGDLHAHTGLSGDAGADDMANCTGSCGNLADAFDTAKSNGLDFVAFADHVNGTAAADPTEWASFHADILAANDPAGGFVTIPAAELWFSLKGGDTLGHKTLLLFGDDATLASLDIDDMRPNGTSQTVDTCDEIWTFMDGLVATFDDALLIPHHPAVLHPMPNDWSCHDDTWEPAVEVYSEHGNSLDDTTSYDVPGTVVMSDSTVWAAYEDYGLRLGFLGGTDAHDTRPGGVCDLDTEHPTHLYAGGLTVVVLDSGESFDRPAIHDAIVAKHTWVTTGPRVPASLAWSAGGVDLGGLGDDVAVPESLDLDVAVSVPSAYAGDVTAVAVVGPNARWSLTDDGSGNWSGTVPNADVPAWAYVEVEIDGAAWYGGVGACDDGGDDWEYLWSSPSTLGVRTDWDADGIATTDGDCDDLDATVHPGAVEVWYDGVDQDCDGDDDDQDGDGTPVADDCDDTDPARAPTLAEVWYDGVDQDCDGNDDDQDGDGAIVGVDCDDLDAGAFPGAEEAWYDGVDQDCDGNDDDRDGDGHASTAVQGGDDCADQDAAIHPGAVDDPYDGVDADCGGDEYDADHDGYLVAAGGGADCDDADDAVHPGADDTWYDGVDQDCDGASDYDRDGDGWDAAAGGGHDCDDDDAFVHPTAVEVWYDGVDQDCDGNDGDRDGDGVVVSLDCDDGDALVRKCVEEEPAPAEPAGCASGSAAPWLGVAGLVLVGARRRRG